MMGVPIGKGNLAMHKGMRRIKEFIPHKQQTIHLFFKLFFLIVKPVSPMKDLCVWLCCHQVGAAVKQDRTALKETQHPSSQPCWVMLFICRWIYTVLTFKKELLYFIVWFRLQEHCKVTWTSLRWVALGFPSQRVIVCDTGERSIVHTAVVWLWTWSHSTFWILGATSLRKKDHDYLSRLTLCPDVHQHWAGDFTYHN